LTTPVFLVETIKRLFPLKLRLASLTRFPPVGAVVERLMFEGDELYYLPRERTVKVEEAVGGSSSLVLPSRIAEHFVERSSFRFLMDSCICRESEGCSHFPRDIGCLFLGEGARNINPRLGKPVGKKEALEHLERAREVGLVQLVGRNKLDTLWLGTGPGNRLMTMCFCCPCCCLWKIAPVVSPSISTKLQRIPGVEIFRSDECNGCGRCLSRCIFGAISIEGGKAIVGKDCRGCGLCVEACPRGALRISLPDKSSIEQVIESLSRAVEVG